MYSGNSSKNSCIVCKNGNESSYIVRKAASRLIALVLCVFFCISVSLSLIFIVEEAHHECAGHECQTCAELHVCEAIVKISVIIYIVAAAGLFGALAIAKINKDFSRNCNHNTLVSLKVKLTD